MWLITLSQNNDGLQQQAHHAADTHLLYSIVAARLSHGPRRRRAGVEPEIEFTQPDTISPYSGVDTRDCEDERARRII
ncbi:hypothetical protein Aduo_012866 [Ancylostoma duodenale]